MFGDNSLRAKGTLISEPRFSTPCEMRFFPREKGKTAFVEGFSLKRAVFPFSRGKNRISQGVENRGSLISVPLALRDFACRWESDFPRASGASLDFPELPGTSPEVPCRLSLDFFLCGF